MDRQHKQVLRQKLDTIHYRTMVTESVDIRNELDDLCAVVADILESLPEDEERKE